MLPVGRDSVTAAAAGNATVQALCDKGFVPHPLKTDTVAKMERVWVVYI